MKNKEHLPRLHVLLVDPLTLKRPALAIALRQTHRVSVAQTKDDLVKVVSQEKPDMIIIDANEHTLNFLSLVNEQDSEKQIPLLLVGQHPDQEYSGDGFNKSALKIWIEQTIAAHQLPTQVANLDLNEQEVLSFGSFLTRSKYFIPTFRTLQRVMNADVPVLITGESGTGKELIAQGIHTQSNRSEQPFVAINCAAIPENLLETELFGYEKGAFTGATTTKIGKLEYAGNGTVFFDEIGDMPILTQVKLLRAIQERSIERVGGHKLLPFNARIVAATNKNLPQEIQMRTFREDLYYRLNTVHVELLPLCERKEDIPLLMEHFIRLFNQRYNRKVLGVSPSVLNALHKHDWPGNVRELVNIIHHAVLLSDTPRIELKDLPPEFRFGEKAVTMLDQLGKMSLDAIVEQATRDFEYQIITLVLEKFHFNKAQSAHYLGIDRKTLYRKIKNLDIPDEKI